MNMNMEKYCICISRQTVSGGRSLARLLSERLGIKVYDKITLREECSENGMSSDYFEHSDNVRNTKGVFSFMRSHLSDGSVSGNIMSDEAAFKFQSDAIRRISERESCIFIGRCADYVLREHGKLFSVFLTADRNERIKKYASKKNCSESKAEILLDRTDKERSNYYNYYTGKEWGMADNYDICINTSSVPEEACVEIICQFMSRKLGIEI